MAPNLVLIVVESRGLPLDSHLGKALTAPYDDPRIEHKYNTSYGTVPFTGLTIPGEARELCRSTIGFGIMHAPAGLVARCLPALFHARGYRNLAVHGYTGQMFYRSDWYPIWASTRVGLVPTCINLAFRTAAEHSLESATRRLPIGSEVRFFHTTTASPSHLLGDAQLWQSCPVPTTPDLSDDGVCTTQPAHLPKFSSALFMVSSCAGRTQVRSANWP